MKTQFRNNSPPQTIIPKYTFRSARGASKNKMLLLGPMKYQNIIYLLWNWWARSGGVCQPGGGRLEMDFRDRIRPEGSQNSSLPWKGTCNISNMELKGNGCSVVVFHYAWTYTGALCLGWSKAGDHKGRLGHHVPSVEHPQQLLWREILWGNECSMTLETSRGQNIFKHCVCIALTSQRNQRGCRKWC